MSSKHYCDPLLKMMVQFDLNLTMRTQLDRSRSGGHSTSQLAWTYQNVGVLKSLNKKVVVMVGCSRIRRF